jgi:hypothetical protein
MEITASESNDSNLSLRYLKDNFLVEYALKIKKKAKYLRLDVGMLLSFGY